jgi:magnesium transporter
MALSEKNTERQDGLHTESIEWEGLVWTDIVNPTRKEMDYLASNFPFHPLDLDDCLSRKQRPKIDEYAEYLFLIFQFSVYNPETRVSNPNQVAVFVGEKFLVTVHDGTLKTLVKYFRECQIDEQVRQENFSHGSGFLTYRILDRAVDAYFPILDKILRLAEDQEDRVFDENVEASHELAILRRDLITQRRIMFPSRAVFAELEGKLKRFTRIDISAYYGDLMDHVNKICDTLDEAREIIEVYKDTDYILGTDRVNRVMRVLAMLFAIVLPFIVVLSVYAMYVLLPGGRDRAGSAGTFVVLIAAIVALIAGLLLFFKRRHWI